MPVTSPGYRLTLYKPRIEDATESAVLTPAAGAPHSDNFIVTTIQGVAGAKPYLEIPRGRQGGFDPVTRKVSTGNLAVDVFDPRTTVGGANASRWVTAFTGTTAGETRLKGCKITLERSLDGGTTWSPYFAGRVRDVALNGAQRLTLDLKDGADELSRQCFLGVPHTSITNAAMASMLPVGPPIAFGNTPATAPLTASLQTLPPNADGTQIAILLFDVTQDPVRSMLTKFAEEQGYSERPFRVIFTSASGTGALLSMGPGGWVEALIPTALPSVVHARLASIYVWTVLPSDPQYLAIPAVVGTITPITCYLTANQPPTAQLPLLINDVHPVQLWADILDGKYSLSSGYGTLRPLGARDTTGGGPWDTLLQDASFGLCRFVIEKPWKANEFIEQQLLMPFGLGCVIDAQGRVQPLDLRRRARTVVANFTDADVIAGQSITWADSRDGAITAVEFDYYSDFVLQRETLRLLPDKYPDVSPTLIQSRKNTIFRLNELSTLRDVGERVVKIDAMGMRVGVVQYGYEPDAQGLSKATTITRDIDAAIGDFLAPFQSGTLKFKVPYRVSSAAAVTQGQFITVDHAMLPNPSTNQRGGPRVALVIGRSEQQGTVILDCLDYGAAATAAVPAITSLALDTGDATAINVTVTANAAGDQVAIWAAMTETSVVVRPVDSADAWMQVGTIIGSGTVRCVPFPKGKRIWFRARSQAIGVSTNAPSAWVYPTPGYLDLAGPTAASTLVATNIFANRLDLAWAAGDPTLVVELFQTPGAVPGTWTTAMLLGSLLPGTTTVRVGFLAALTQYSFGVRVRDANGGSSAMVTLTVTTSSIMGVAPQPLLLDTVATGFAA